MDTSTTKDKLARFGRTLALLLNRSLMYQKSHPMVKGSIQDVHTMAELLLQSISPVVFILNRQQFYVDEEQLDPRINVKRIAHLFITHGIQSISFESSLTASEIEIFIEIFSSMTMETNADVIKKELIKRGAYNIRVNHVLYKKVTEDDQVVSREALKQVTPSMEDDDSESRKKFMDTLLETILTEEFANTLNIKSLLENPGQVSKNMIKADLASAKNLGGGGSTGTGGGGGIAGPGAGDGAAGVGFGTGMGPAGPGGDGSPGSGMGPGGPGGGLGDGQVATDGTGAGNGAAGVSFGTGMGPAGPGGDGSPGGGMGPGGPGGGLGDGQAATAIASGASSATALGGGTHDKDSQSGTASHTGGNRSSELAVAGKDITAASGEGHGHMLLHQLDLIQQEVQRQLMSGGDISLEELADAVFEMKKQLFEDIQTQKALGIAYANENAIVDNINELTDKVLLELIQEEYKNGQITTQRFAQIILRLIPDPQELKRLLPKIKSVLLECGMQPDAYLELVDELKHVLQNEELSRIIEESSEAIGVDSEELIEELKEDSGQAAKLIYLASEIRKSGGDEAALSDILVDYVEKMSGEAAKTADGEEHLKKAVSDIESTVLGQLAEMDVGEDVLARMEERINDRMDSILDKMRVEWLQTQASKIRKEKTRPLTVLQTLEHNVGDDEELEGILRAVRAKVDEGEIEENNFSAIHMEINRQKKQLEKATEDADTPEGVLSRNELIFILEKEIARANRYNAPFSALAFSFVDAKPKMKALENLITTELVMSAALEKLVSTIREVDYIGQIGKNKMVALLPMIDLPAAKLALRRVMNLLHNEPLLVKEVPVKLRVAGVVAEYDADQTPDAYVFAKKISNQLMDMVSRIKNIQILF
jgi:GGDEF domain-containing protein